MPRRSKGSSSAKARHAAHASQAAQEYCNSLLPVCFYVGPKVLAVSRPSSYSAALRCTESAWEEVHAQWDSVPRKIGARSMTATMDYGCNGDVLNYDRRSSSRSGHLIFGSFCNVKRGKLEQVTKSTNEFLEFARAVLMSLITLPVELSYPRVEPMQGARTKRHTDQV